MDWIKVKVKHADYDFATAPDHVFRAWITMMTLVAAIERKPLRKSLCNRLGEKNYNELEKYLQQNDTSVDTIIDKVLEDVDHVNIRKAHSRKYMRKYRSKSLRNPLRKDNVNAKRREEKRREEKSILYIEHPPFVRLKDKDVTDFNDKYGTTTTKLYIDKINDYLSSTGRKPYKDYAAAIRQWMRKDNIVPVRKVAIPQGKVDPKVAGLVHKTAEKMK